MDEDQLYVEAAQYRPPPVTEMIPADPIAERLAQLPTRLDVWRAALLGTLTGAAIVIGWIELVHRVCL
jgi:trans-aconitate methyltransferase